MKAIDVLKAYGIGVPIFIEDLYKKDANIARVRNLVKRMTDTGKLVRFEKGVYYIPGDSTFKFDENSFTKEVITRRFITDGDNIYGYIVDTKFRDHISSKPDDEDIPTCKVYEVTSNRASLDFREFRIGNASVVVRQPKIEINKDNHKVLGFLEMVKDLIPDDNSYGRNTQFNALWHHIEENKIDTSLLMKYIEYFPDKLAMKLLVLGFFKLASREERNLNSFF